MYQDFRKKINRIFDYVFKNEVVPAQEPEMWLTGGELADLLKIRCLHLLETMHAGEAVVPKNAIVTGMGKIVGERIGISITSLKYRGLIISIELNAPDYRFCWKQCFPPYL